MPDETDKTTVTKEQPKPEPKPKLPPVKKPSKEVKSDYETTLKITRPKF